MYKTIGTLLLFALFISASAFTTNTPAAVVTSASSHQIDWNFGKKAITSLTWSQTAAQTLTATWTVVPPTGPYVVRLYNAMGLILQVVNETNLFHNFNKLTIGQSYRVSVQDLQGTVILSGLVTVTF